MSETDNSSDGTSTQKPTDTRLSDEDITRLNDSILKKFPHLGKPQDTPTKPPVTPTTTPATPTIATTEVDYKAKYETMEKQFRTDVLETLPDDLKDKYKEASFEELKIIRDLLPRLKTSKKSSAISRDKETDEKDTAEEGHIGGYDSKTKKWK